MTHFMNKPMEQPWAPPAHVQLQIFSSVNLQKNISLNGTFLPRFYRQYRDDSFGIWLHGEETLKEYLIYLNTLHETIQFTLSFGKQIQYLDLNINLTSWGTCNTETYYKPTDNFQYLDANSNHPQSTINNIPKSQLLRHIRNCSTPSALLAHTSNLAHNLKKRTYPIKTINEIYL